jgi:hypothetical protein
MSKYVKIIEKFVFSDKISWGRDTKSAKTLLKKFPEEDFWDWIEPYPMVDSLFKLLSEKNIEYLNKKYLIFLSQKKTKEGKEKLKENLDQRQDQAYNLQESKVGEDLILVKKPTTIKEFLNYGKTSETN